MKPEALSALFTLQGHGVYLWGALAVVLLVMVVEPLLAARRHRKALSDAEAAGQVEN
ncbi:MAG: heme exporter protein CcmD [Burkholderiaceae bacterium]|nr:heme exporter protein CcmD [Burkholderiaceae bacterium]